MIGHHLSINSHGRGIISGGFAVAMSFRVIIKSLSDPVELTVRMWSDRSDSLVIRSALCMAAFAGTSLVDRSAINVSVDVFP